MKFSIVIPTVNRPGLERAIRSVAYQTFKEWELIVVNDNPTSLFNYDMLARMGLPVRIIKQVKLLNLEKKGGKLVARNTGMENATGDWICWLDDDDEYSCRYLEYVDRFANEKPGMALMNFGIIRYWRGGQTDFLPIYDFGKVELKSGMIATGTFAFKRACFGVVGPFPAVTNPTEFAKRSGIPHYDGSADGRVRHMGNPWGDDFWYFHQLLKNYQSHSLQAYLYYQHVGGGHNV